MLLATIHSLQSDTDFGQSGVLLPAIIMRGGLVSAAVLVSQQQMNIVKKALVVLELEEAEISGAFCHLHWIKGS